MFLGTYLTKFSGFNRIILPKKLRLALSSEKEIVLTRGLDLCIWGFGKDEWETQALKQLEIPLTEERGRYLRREFFSEAEICELDGQGRFIIPTALANYAKTEGAVLIIGAGDHFEIWNPQIWSDFSK